MRVEDGKGGSDTESFTIVVEEAGVTPVNGRWAVTAPNFGQLDFLVSSNGSQTINDVNVQFQNLACGGCQVSGGVNINRSPPWSIDEDGSFTIDFTVGANSYSFVGAFTSESTAAGTWTANQCGGTCTGSWTAEPAS